jgi:hypothetical protein
LIPLALSASEGGSFRLSGGGAKGLALSSCAGLHDTGLEALFLQPASLLSLDETARMALVYEHLSGGIPLQQATLLIGRGSGHQDSRSGSPQSSAALAAAFQYRGADLADASRWQEWTLSVAGAWSPFRWLATGFRADHSRGGSEDDLDRGRAFSLSLGLKARLLSPSLEAGFFLEDLVHEFLWDGGSVKKREASPVLSLGMNDLHLPYLRGDFRLETAARYRFNDLESLGLGLEWNFIEDLAVFRCGLRHWSDERLPVEFSFGFGLSLSSLYLDYAHATSAVEAAGARHRITLTRPLSAN